MFRYYDLLDLQLFLLPYLYWNFSLPNSEFVRFNQLPLYYIHTESVPPFLRNHNNLLSLVKR